MTARKMMPEMNPQPNDAHENAGRPFEMKVRGPFGSSMPNPTTEADWWAVKKQQRRLWSWTDSILESFNRLQNGVGLTPTIS